MNAWYNVHAFGDIDFLSYDTYLMTISFDENCVNPNFLGCRIVFYNYVGTTTQKQMTCFINDFCGVQYVKYYKKARYLLRKNQGDYAVLYRDKYTEKYIAEIKNYSRTIKKVIL